MSEIQDDIERVGIDELAPYPNNPKEHPDEQIDKLVGSIKEYGFVQPLVVNEESQVIIGHGRLKAAKRIAMDEVPAIDASHLTDAQQKALRLADNRMSETGWDMEALGTEFEGLYEMGFDIDYTGFDDQEVEEAVNLEPELDEVEEVDTPELPEEARTNKGDLWILGDHRLLCGDATNEADVERLMNGRQAEIVFTSPPYNAGDSAELSGNTNTKKDKYNTNFDDNKTENEWLSLVDDSLKIMRKVSEYQFYNIQQLAGNKRAFIDLLQNNKDYFADVAIWDKKNAPPNIAENVMDSRFEFVIIFSSENEPTRAIKTANFRGEVHNVYEGRNQRKNDFSDVHAATFPVDFPSHFIKNFTSMGDTVIDNFAGTGGTVIACEQLNRKCKAIELGPTYCDVIVQRWEDYTGKEAHRERP